MTNKNIVKLVGIKYYVCKYEWINLVQDRVQWGLLGTRS